MLTAFSSRFLSLSISLPWEFRRKFFFSRARFWCSQGENLKKTGKKDAEKKKKEVVYIDVAEDKESFFNIKKKFLEIHSSKFEESYGSFNVLEFYGEMKDF